MDWINVAVSWLLVSQWKQILIFFSFFIFSVFTYKFLRFDEDGELSSQEKVRVVVWVCTASITLTIIVNILWFS